MAFFIPKELEKYTDAFNPKCFVYFISDGEHTKIGVAKNMEKRLSSLQVGNPKKLKIVSFVPCCSEHIARKIEKYLHESLSGCRMVGEWFNLPASAFLHKFLYFVVDYEDWERRYANVECRRNYKAKYCYGKYTL